MIWCDYPFIVIRKAQEDISLYKKLFEEFQKFDNFGVNLEEIIYCVFQYAKCIFSFLIIGSFSFCFIILFNYWVIFILLYLFLFNYWVIFILLHFHSFSFCFVAFLSVVWNNDDIQNCMNNLQILYFIDFSFPFVKELR